MTTVLAGMGEWPGATTLLSRSTPINGSDGASGHLTPAPVIWASVRLPSRLFEKQPPEYRDSVIPPAVTARVCVEQASTFGWERYAGATGKDGDFYRGKVAAASFYAKNVLPKLAAERAIAEATDNDLMDVPESAF